MSELQQGTNWSLLLRVALIIMAIGLGLAGVFNFERLACQVCWKDITRHFFAFYGYFAAFGFAIGWTLPERRTEEAKSSVQWNTRQGFWEGSLGTAALLSIMFAVLQVLG